MRFYDESFYASDARFVVSSDAKSSKVENIFSN